jgi:hypothetical protein
MRHKIAFFSLLVVAGVFSIAQAAYGQAEVSDSGAKMPTKSVQPYRLDFSLYELEDGKKINTRHYSMNLNSGMNNDLKIGAKVPVPTGPSNSASNTQFQYMDIGTSINAQLRERDGDQELIVRAETSNVDLPSTTIAPIVRQIRIEGSTLLVVGKPILIGSVDDANSKREFQLEVLVTKLR